MSWEIQVLRSSALQLRQTGINFLIRMVNHPRKRQKTRRCTPEEVRPLGSYVSLTEDANKDEEERRLESLLFGTPFVRSGKEKTQLAPHSDEDDGEVLGDGKELENLTDADVSSPSQNYLQL